MSVARKLIESHLVGGKVTPGEEIALRIDQTLTQDATGTLVMLELEAMGLDRVKTELSAQYIDHNLLQEDHKNADDHLFLFSACQRLGVWYSKAGNGVSHVVHQENFGKPGKTLLGADSHTPAAGSIGMLAVGAGGLEVALAMAGEPFFVKMPRIWGVKLVGKLPPWVSAKDVILEMLRRHGVSGGAGKIIEYWGPGLECLTVMDRHVIANMGTELGATTTVFPSDREVKRFFDQQGRPGDWREILPDKNPAYDLEEQIDLSSLEPLTALPSSPGKVVPVKEVEGREIYQSYLGSSANPGYRDLAVCAEMVKGRTIPAQVSFDINPASQRILLSLIEEGSWQHLLAAGARFHQTGCNGCIGMGQAPATNKISLRTVPRNFPGRSGTPDDQVYLVSPETATASALKGVITDPRKLDISYPVIREPEKFRQSQAMLVSPLDPAAASRVMLRKGPNIVSIPELDPLPDEIELPVLLKVKDDISTDEILPAGAKILPLRSNIPKISEYVFHYLDPTYAERTEAVRGNGGHAIVGGLNYGQGSSREHAALAPRYLGLRMVIAKGFARIHWQNLINFGVLPLVFVEPAGYDLVQQGDVLKLAELKKQLSESTKVHIENVTQRKSMLASHTLSKRQVEILLKGGLIQWMKRKLTKRRDK